MSSKTPNSKPETPDYSVSYGNAKISFDILGNIPKEFVKYTCSKISEFMNKNSFPERNWDMCDDDGENKTVGFCSKTVVVIRRGKNVWHCTFENMIGQDVQSIINMISSSLSSYENIGRGWDMCEDIDVEIPVTPKEGTSTI